MEMAGCELAGNRSRCFRRFSEHCLGFLVRGKVIEFEFEVRN
jgi:hypothetical protein